MESPTIGDYREHLVGMFRRLIHRRELFREHARERSRLSLVSMVLHDLRTPVSHIKGFASTLRQTDVEWDEATRQDFLAEIEREADRLARVIGDLLDVSRLEYSGLDSREWAPAVPSVIVAGGLDRVRGLLAERRVLVDVPTSLPPLRADASQLERVVANLVENAARYSPPQRPIRISAALGGRGLELRVEDDGPGIPEEHLERIFEKFVRLESADPHGGSGTGLGLAICRGIVHAHGGRIWAENRSEGGSRFVVRLPLAAGAAQGGG